MGQRSSPDLLSLEKKRRSALLNGDVAELEKLLAPELVYIHSTGRIDYKQSLLESVASGRLKYVSIDFDEVRTVELSSGAAAIHMRVETRVLLGGAEIAMCNRVACVWKRQADEAWALCLFQATPIAAAATASAALSKG